MALLLSIVAVSRVARSDASPDVVVIVNAANATKALSADEVKTYYFGDKVQWPGGTTVKLYGRSADSPVTAAFFRDILQMAPARFRRHWQEHTFAGKPGAAPEEVEDAAGMFKRVGNTPGAIGYVGKGEAGALPATVHALKVQ